MTNKEILKRAITKAIDSGWNKAISFRLLEPPGVDELIVEWKDEDNGVRYSFYEHVQDFIFNHDFAKALWGDLRDLRDVQYVLELGEGEVTTPIYRLAMPLWKFHLQQMVIADDALKYLGEHLEG